MLAREIQLNLLPNTAPKHDKLELHGKMESSVEVGGDYYDFFEISPHRIGVAIGDVSGKGVPAAMLVSSLQAVFKNLARRDKMNPAQVIEELNRYLCDNAKSGQYATILLWSVRARPVRIQLLQRGSLPDASHQDPLRRSPGRRRTGPGDRTGAPLRGRARSHRPRRYTLFLHGWGHRTEAAQRVNSTVNNA